MNSVDTDTTDGMEDEDDNEDGVVDNNDNILQHDTYVELDGEDGQEDDWIKVECDHEL